MSKVLFDHDGVAIIEWQGPDLNGRYDATFGRLSLSISRLNDEYEWDIADQSGDYSFDAGAVSSIEEAKLIIAQHHELEKLR